jgi:hypothetical protein
MFAAGTPGIWVVGGGGAAFARASAALAKAGPEAPTAADRTAALSLSRGLLEVVRALLRAGAPRTIQ